MKLGDVIKLMRQQWPFDHSRRLVVEGYASLASNHRHLLTDIALRGGVFSAPPPPPDLFTAGVNEGRRQMALEIFQLANIDPRLLWDLVEKKPAPSENRT